MSAAGNLTAAAGAFVGKGAELASLVARLGQPGVVVLTGPAGVGKTRLAREAGLAHRAATGTAVWFCELSVARSGEDVCRAVARELGVALSSGGEDGDPSETVGRALASRGRVVVVADNFEQVVEHAATTVARWAALAPEATLVVTSRERLGLVGEEDRDVAPLSPDGEAVPLFVERARAARSDFVLDDGNRQAVTDLVRGLDGLPLAIELAAARVAILTPAQMLARLGDRFELLRARRRDDPARHHGTLREAIDWSWNLLEPREQESLEACAVFRGGFSLDAAEAVLGGPEPLDRLQALRDKSLLVAHTSSDAPDELRYDLLESIRAYGRERLEATGRGAAVEARHAAFFAGLAGRLEGDGARRLRRLSRERENLESAARRAAALAERGAHPEAARWALDAALALDPVTEAQGPWAGTVALLGEVRAACAEAGRRDAGVVARIVRATIARSAGLRRMGRTDEAIVELEGAIAAAARVGDGPLEARALSQWASVRSYGDPSAARGRFERALVLAAGDPQVEGTVRGHFAAAEHLWGNYEACVAQAERALALLEGAGEPRELAWTLIVLSQAMGELGQLEPARALCRRCAEIARTSGNRWLEMFTLHIEAALLAEEGRMDLSRARHESILSIAREIGDRWFEGVTGCYLARVLFEEGQVAQAREKVEGAIAILVAAGDGRNEALGRALLGAIAARQGHAGPAAQELGRAEEKARALGHGLLAALVALWRGHLDLARARDAVVRGDGAEARAAVAAAAARHAAGAEVTGSEDGRAAVRILGAALRAARAERGVVRVSPDGGRLVLPEGRAIELRRQRALKGLVRALALAGKPLSVDELFEAGWPGERARPDSRANRVWVALSQLRALGLRELLVSDDEGYRFDPAVRLVVGEP